MLKEAKNDIKKTWKILRPLLGKQRQKEPILNDFLINNNTVTDSSAIANEFSKFFGNVGKDLQNNIPNSQKSYESYLTGNRPMNSVFLNPVTENEIKDVLNKLNSKKSTGHDGISNYILKKNIAG